MYVMLIHNSGLVTSRVITSEHFVSTSKKFSHLKKIVILKYFFSRKILNGNYTLGNRYGVIRAFLFQN